MLAIDPGLDGLGVALFAGDELLQAWYSPGETRKRDARGALERGPSVWAGLARNVAWLNDAPGTRPDNVVVERMKVYDGRAGFGKDADDLIELSGVAGAVVGTFPGAIATGYLACDWKGQVPKKIMLERIKAWIAARGWSDRVLVPEHAPALVHNAIDAAGLGMVALGLEGKKRG